MDFFFFFLIDSFIFYQLNFLLIIVQPVFCIVAGIATTIYFSEWSTLSDFLAITD